MEEIQKIALEYMRNEDKKCSSVPRNSVPKAGKFHDYTPLNASIAEIYQQVSNKGSCLELDRSGPGLVLTSHSTVTTTEPMDIGQKTVLS
ncbi:hypothetical protein PIB30_065181 [Stylosanthes scabra]|uniref:Uncharacterized protein n=1 Tax=Stylosanthes scabra TaxID=79078 RepID=A0ABU6WNI8_9FABA|nr:hypothetical protein [Stylosanthes scabra]